MQDHYQCIHKLFEEQVAARGEATALVFLGEEISYRELDQRAQQLAHYLRALGVNTETIVALLPQRNIEMVVALLAVLTCVSIRNIHASVCLSYWRIVAPRSC